MKKVANSEAIENAKYEFIEKVKEALDMNEIKKILEDQHNLEIGGDLQVQRGEPLIHNNRLVYRMEFDVLLSLSVLLDEEGSYIPSEEPPEVSIDQLGSQAEDIIQEM
ncbi:hypothetical protein QUF80_11140 [Desulfococcaceae bacterium HSG8]|nr:hypothetical protein [Desulfococcaceae bacterium HSG8]